MATHWYPLTFDPVLKEKIWGGYKLHKLFDKGDDPNAQLGESWEIADLPEGQCVVNKGGYKGLTLGDIISKDPSALLGKAVYSAYGKQFPLLIKFIDAAKDLSIQVHPSDETSPTGVGKTEMWYIMQADEGAQLTVGFKEKTNKKDFKQNIDALTVEQVMDKHVVKPGDSYFINAGRIHAIGSGTLLAEIQQTSDVTYRVYDYNRKDKEGNLRELHIEESLDVLDFKPTQDFKLEYNREAHGPQVLKHHTYFKTDWLSAQTGSHKIERSSSFTIIITVKGEITYTFDSEKNILKAGQTILIPAACDVVEIQQGSGEYLEVYL